ncbi:hypothetical protein [Lichenifustis flavocetrariae]|uniref:Uncharacterized protein n=1 Tax=Lichenifustis flavocetrariae TaxID=2949735 RepID=A0AA41Z1Q6_9HYPH|nr:hypothetical protein [Lichenifustis flavocetrariae]MCW6512621.1 hypothetical protein [Lichenifustis flavocetrariae]
MRDRLSGKLRLVWSQGKDMSEAIAFEVKTICRRAAEPIQPGEGVKTQLRRAWENLGRPPFWRVRAGWYDSAGSWSASAVKDFQARYLAMLERERRRAVQAKAIEAAKGHAGEPDFVQLARADYQDLVQRIAALEAALRL